MPTIQVGPGSAQELQDIADVLGRSRRVIVVTGAGISTNCGIPDFRSEDGLYSLVQAQYDAALLDPPWQATNTYDIDDRPKKKRKSWYYEVVAPDGEVVDVIDEDQREEPLSDPPLQLKSRPSSIPRSSNTTISNSRSSTPSASSDDSSLSSCPSIASNTAIKDQDKQSPGSELAEAITVPEVQFQVTTQQPSTCTQLSTAQKHSTNRTSTEPSNTLSSQATLSRTTSATQTEGPTPQSSQASSRQSLPNIKGRDLFDQMIWQDPFTTSIFYMFITGLRQKVLEVRTTSETHKFLRTLRDGGRLVRNYTQNIDMLESREGLCTDLVAGPGNRSRFNPKVQRSSRGGSVIERDHSLYGGCESVALHGALAGLRCQRCAKISRWDESERLATTLSGSAPECPHCIDYNAKRTGRGRRGLGVGSLRPDIVLYGEEHPQANLIGVMVEHDISLGPDVLLIMGTSLRVHGLKVMIREFSKAVGKQGGKVIFVNQTKPSESAWGELMHYWVEWDCDEWVLDLKVRREDLWRPQGTTRACQTKRQSRESGNTKESIPGRGKPKQRPRACRDDKANGAYVTFKILDTLRNAVDENGLKAPRSAYFPPPAKRKSDALVIKNKALDTSKTSQKPTEVNRPGNAVASRNTSKATTTKKAQKRKASPPPRPEDVKEPTAYMVTKMWENLRKVAPGLPAIPPELRLPFSQLPLNRPDYLKPFAFDASSNHFPNIGGADWPLKKMNLITHPPNQKGAAVPVHTPAPSERKAVKEEKKVIREIRHSYGTRAARLSGATTVVHEGATSDATVKAAAERSSSADTTIVVEGPILGSPEARIKDSCSIGNIVSPPQSPEDESSGGFSSTDNSEIWHDAPELIA